MNKTELIRATAKRAGVKLDTADGIINAALDVITDAISSGQPVKLQKFGTLQVKQRQAAGRNFQTGEALPPRDVKYVHFEPCDSIKAAVNEEAQAQATDDTRPRLYSRGEWMESATILVSVNGTKRWRKIYKDYQRGELYVTYKRARYYQQDFDTD